MSDWKENTLKAHGLNQLPHFKIYYGSQTAKGAGNPIFTSDKQSDFNRAHAKLKTCLDLITTEGAYMVQFKGAAEDSSGILNYTFQVPYSSTSTPPAVAGLNGATPNGFVTRDDMMRQLQIQKDIWDKEKLIEEYEAQLEELEDKLKKSDKAANPWNEAIEMVRPYMPAIGALVERWAGAGAGTAVQASISGLNANQVPVTEEQQEDPETEQQPETEEDIKLSREKLGAVIEFVTKIKGDKHKGVDWLYDIVLKLEKNPNMVTMIDGMLKN